MIQIKKTCKCLKVGQGDEEIDFVDNQMKLCGQKFNLQAYLLKKYFENSEKHEKWSKNHP